MGNIQFLETGILFTATGIAMDPACCCEYVTPGEDCQYCPDVDHVTPLNLTIAVGGGWSLNCCSPDYYEDPVWAKVTWSGSFPATIQLTQYTACVWKAEAPTDGWLFRIYDNPNCTGTPLWTEDFGDIALTLYYQVERTATGWKAYINVVNVVALVDMIIFNGDEVSAADCMDGIDAIPNEGICGFWNAPSNMGTFSSTGSISVEAGP